MDDVVLLKEETLQLYQKGVREEPFIALKEVRGLFHFKKKMKERKFGGYWVMVDPIVKPHEDGVTIPNSPRVASLEDGSQRPYPSLNARPRLRIT